MTDLLSTSMRQVGHVCWRWNQDCKQAVWNMCPQGNFLHRETISSRQMMQTLLTASSSSTVASG